MRYLFILRGAPGSGKSTWVKENELDSYTISTDTLRLMYQSPVTNIDGTRAISQNHDTEVWKMVLDLMERRMDNGELVIIDATHYKSSLINSPLEPYIMPSDIEKVVIFGDIHGCYDPLKEYFDKNPFSENVNYIFTGDYLDRGIQNKEVLEFLISLKDYKNVIFLEGNHEKWLRMYADKHFNMQDYIKEEIVYKDPFVTKVLSQLRDRVNSLEKKIKINTNVSEELSKLLREAWETNPNNKEVYYEFELVNVPEKQKQLHAEIRVAELQLDILRRYINVLQHEEHNTKDYIKTINEWYKEQFNCGLSLDITNILTKNYAVMANKQDNPIKSPEFIKRTYPQIKDIDKTEIRRFCDRLAQMSYFTFNGFNYFVCHGGLPCLPTMKTQTIEMIKGVGKYEEHEIIDKQFCKNTDSHTYQIHAHRNIFNEPLKLDGTANLEGKVEFGGHLRIIELTKDNVNCIEIKNNVFAQTEEKSKEEKTHLEILRDMYRSPLVQVKELGDNIISLNFTREAFYDKKWNDLTCKARGLFVDKTNGNVVAESYQKFFNRNELDITKAEALKNTFQYPVIGYKKENGFLALISKYQDKVHFFTKSTNQGDYVNWFIGVLCDKYNIYYETDYKNYSYGDIYNIVQNNNNCCKNDVHLLELNKHILQSMKQTLIDIIGKYIEEGKTYIFECVDINNDPHIIKYDESNVYLLDVKNNNFNEEYMSYEDVCKVAEQLQVPVKQAELKFNNWDEFNDWRMKFSNGITQWDCKHEGYVMVDANNFRVKYKSSFYNFWKQIRAVKESIQRGSGNKKIYKTKEEIQVVKLLENIPKEELKQMSIIDIEDMFYKEYEV